MIPKQPIYALTMLLTNLPSFIMIAYFFTKTLTPKWSAKKTFYISCLITLLPTIIISICGQDFYTVGSIGNYISTLFILFVFFKDSFITKICAMIFMMGVLFTAQMLVTVTANYSFQLIIQHEFMIEPDIDIYKDPLYIFYYILNGISSTFFLYKSTKLWNTIYRELDLKTFLMLFLYPNLIWSPIMVLLVEHANILPIFVIFLLLIISGNIFTIKGFQTCRKIIYDIPKNQDQINLIQQQLERYQHIEHQQLELKKWNHDAANYLQTVHFLLTEHKYHESEKYLLQLISELERNEEE